MAYEDYPDTYGSAVYWCAGKVVSILDGFPARAEMEEAIRSGSSGIVASGNVRETARYRAGTTQARF